MSSQLTLVVIPKYDHAKFLKSIDKYRITHLLYVHVVLFSLVYLTILVCFRVVPPQVVLLCKVRSSRRSSLAQISYTPVASRDEEI